MTDPSRADPPHFTRVGILILATGWACFPLALVTGSLAPAVLGSLLVALVVTRPPPTAALSVERDVPARVTEGERITMITRVTDAHGLAPVFIELDALVGVNAVRSRHSPARGRAERETSFVPWEPGARVWSHVTVRYQDPWGLVEVVTRLPMRGALHVLPAGDTVAAGRRAGRNHGIGSQDRALSGGAVAEEVERVREYRPGDRLRDIHWASSTKLQNLMTREFRREAPRPILVLVHAGESMRIHRRHVKLASATRAALGVIAAAQAAQVPAGFVAWSERGVEAVVRTTTTRRAVADALVRVSALPPTIVTRDVPRTRVPTRDALVNASPEERKFLKAANAFARSSGSVTPVESALAGVGRATSVPALVIAFVDAEEEPALARTVLTRLTRAGHRVLLVAPATGPHHYAVSDVNDAIARRLATWWRNRAEVERVAEAFHAPFLSLGPHVDARVVEEVVLSAR